MRFLHLADLHIGKTVNGFNLIEDQRHALNELLARAIEEKVDAILISGDVYDKRNPSVIAVDLVGRFLTDVVKANLVALVIPGNHDSAELIGFGASIFARSCIHIQSNFQGHIETVTLTDEHGPVTFWLLPYVRPFKVRHLFPDIDIDTYYSRALKAIMDSTPLDRTQRNVLLAHQYVSFQSFKPTQSESETTVGWLEEVDGSVFEGFDYVALGHIHKSQAVGLPTMRYAGSLLKYSFSEARYRKEFPLVTMGAKGDISIETVSFTPLHDMREIKGPFEELISEEVVNGAPADDYLHITLTDPHPVLDALQKLRAVYPNVMTLDYETDLQRAQRDDAPLTIDEKQTNLLDLFERFYELQYGSPPTDLQRDRARDALQHMLEEDTIDPRAYTKGTVSDEPRTAEGDTQATADAPAPRDHSDGENAQ